MILPTIRSSFDRADARFLIWLLTRGADAEREREEVRLRDEGLDAILDDPRTLNAILTGSQFSSARPELVFYVLVRHALLEGGIADRGVADYLAERLQLLAAISHDLQTPITRIGLTICYDVRFPALFHRLGQLGLRCTSLLADTGYSSGENYALLEKEAWSCYL